MQMLNALMTNVESIPNASSPKDLAKGVLLQYVIFVIRHWGIPSTFVIRHSSLTWDVDGSTLHGS
jgi:hypothetical protein